MLIFRKTRYKTAINKSNKKEIGIIVWGELVWDNKKYRVLSGPWDRGVLPNGEYEVKKYNVCVGDALGVGYAIGSNTRWTIPIKPKFLTDRDGLEIHPDGNIEGTRGCIGIIGDDAKKFWKDWNDIAMAERPTDLTVEGEVGTGGYLHEVDGV